MPNPVRRPLVVLAAAAAGLLAAVSFSTAIANAEVWSIANGGDDGLGDPAPSVVSVSGMPPFDQTLVEQGEFLINDSTKGFWRLQLRAAHGHGQLRWGLREHLRRPRRRRSKRCELDRGHCRHPVRELRPAGRFRRRGARHLRFRTRRQRGRSPGSVRPHRCARR